MSLVNQVLGDLEKRGASTLPQDASIRVVHTRKNQTTKVIVLAAVLALVSVAAGLWWRSSQPGKVTVHADANPAPVLSGSKLPAIDTSNKGVSESVSMAQPSEPVAAHQAELPPVAVAAQGIPREEVRQTGKVKAAGAATHLSFELSAIPPSSGLQAKPVAAATGQRHEKAALPEHKMSADRDSAAVARSDPSAAKQKNQDDASATAVVPAGVDKQIKQVSVQQQADSEFRRASGLVQQGRINDAIAGYGAALQLDAGHDAARQALAGLLLENKHNADAERVLQDGLKHNPRQSGFAMLLARLQVERNELAPALETLQKTLPYAEQQADYRAFVAALLQRQGRHDEAVAHYQAAVQLAPNSGVWLMGLGMSLQALQRNGEARDAFKRAIETRTLSAELQAFIEQRLKEL